MTKIAELQASVEDLESKVQTLETRMDNGDYSDAERFAALEAQVSELMKRLPKPKPKQPPTVILTTPHPRAKRP